MNFRMQVCEISLGQRYLRALKCARTFCCWRYYVGLGLVRSEIHDISEEQRSAERRANVMRFLTIMAFTLGSTVGAFIFFAFGYLGFLFPAVISFYFWRVARRS